MLSGLILQGAASGIATGCIYALVALSLVIVYKSTEVVNFAGGELVMIGSYLGLLFLVYFGVGYVLTIVLVMAVTFVAGALFDRIALDRIAGHSVGRQIDLVPLVVATIALSDLLKGAVRIFPYTQQVRRLPPLFSGPPLFLGDVVLLRQDLGIIAVTAVIMVALWLFFRLTLIGKGLSATSQNARAAALSGIPVRRMRMSVWGIAAMLAGIAGVLLAPKLLMTPDMGAVVMLAFAAAVIGGFTSVPGCVIGGIVLGVVQNMVGIFVSPDAIAVTPFFVIMLVLLIRPQGLLGGAVVVRKV